MFWWENATLIASLADLKMAPHKLFKALMEKYIELSEVKSSQLMGLCSRASSIRMQCSIWAPLMIPLQTVFQ